MATGTDIGALAERRRQMEQFVRSRMSERPGSIGLPPAPPDEDTSITLPGMPGPQKPDLGQVGAASRDVTGGDEPTVARPTQPSVTAGRAMQAFTGHMRPIHGRDALVPDEPESGTLPGEERITTQDTLRAMSPAEQSSLQKKFEGGGHSNTMSYDDWLSENFGDIPPTDRLAQMRQSAVMAPRVKPVGDPTLSPGEQTMMAKERRLAGRPIPEGREPDHYSKVQAREMSRNVRNPDIQMTRFGGTFTHNPDGSKSARAPSPQAMELANFIAADPTQGPMSDSHIAALAQAYGIDAIKYGDDLDLLRSDVMREKERHDQLAGKYEAVPTGAGGVRYKPTAAFRERLAMQDQRRFLRDLTNRNQGLQGQAGGQDAQEIMAQIEQAAGTQGGKDQMVALGQKLRQIREGNQHQAARNRAQNYNISQDLRNPNQAPGMAVRSLQEAVASNNPLQMAAVYDIFGNPQAGMQNRQLAAVQGTAAGKVAEAQEEAQAAIAATKPDDKTVAANWERELRDAYALPVMEQYGAIQRVVEGMHPNSDPAFVADRVQNLMAGNRARTQGLNDPFVKSRLDSIRQSGNRAAFVQFAMQIGAAQTAEQANYLFDNPTPPVSAREAGRQATATMRAGVGNLVTGVPEFLKGAFGL
jgi:hypothetical protein